MNFTDKQKESKRSLSGWALVAVIALPILVIAAVVSWFGSGQPSDAGGSLESDIERIGVNAPDQQGEFAVPQASMGDFDSGRQVPNQSGQADFEYQARTGSDRFFSAVGDAAFAIIGRTESPNLSAVKVALQESPLREINLNDMSPGFWLAVRTSEGRYAAYTIKSHAGISPGTIRIQYLLWDNDHDGRDH